MKKNLFVTVIILCFTSLVFAQDNAAPDMEKLMRSTMYGNMKKTFQTKKTLPNSVKSKTEFVWEKVSKIDKSKLSAHFDFLTKNFVYTIEHDKLELKAKFPEKVEYDQSFIDFKIDSYSLKNEKGAIVDLYTNINVTNFGSESCTPKSEDNIESSFNNEYCQTVNQSINLKSSPVSLKGTITLDASITLSYDKIKLTKADIGKEFTFNNGKYKLLSNSNGLVMIQSLGGDGEFECMITNTENKAYNGGRSKSKMSMEDFNFANNNPTFTEEQFNIYFESIKAKLKEKKIEKNIYVFNFDGEAVNLYLYKKKEVFAQKLIFQIK